MDASSMIMTVGCATVAFVGGWWVARRTSSVATTPFSAEEPSPMLVATQAVDPGVKDMFAVLRSCALLIGANDEVVLANHAATATGLVRDRDLHHEELRDLARYVRREQEIIEEEMDLARGPLGSGTLHVSARVAPLGEHLVLLLIEDRTHARRVEEVRRDFVANVSHELKTPVGGISLLAEAVLDANDDPEAVTRFARRIKVESRRLTNLVQEIVDLSRLQASESLSDPELCEVGGIVAESLESVRTVAEAKEITFTASLTPGCKVYGDSSMLGTAVNNLLINAITYSEQGGAVGVSVRQTGDVVEVAVADRGIGISSADQERIFERFYRVDSARSRATGGTGLGLAIVKHICNNHGGDVSLWSELGRGSTFTIRLPAATHWSEAPAWASADEGLDPAAEGPMLSVPTPNGESAHPRDAREETP